MISAEQIDRLFVFLFNAGFLRSVEDRLRAEIVIRRFESVATLDQLQTILAPVVARSPEQLKTFEELFDTFVAAETKPPVSERPSAGAAVVVEIKRRWRTWAGVGTVAALIVLGMLIVRPPPVERTSGDTATGDTATGSTRPPRPTVVDSTLANL